MIPHYLLWKKLQSKHFIVPVKAEWDSFRGAQRESEYVDRMICRVCMSPADIPITEKIDDLSILGAIRAVANIWINETDGYPKYICMICLEELKTALMFKRKCENSDRKFRKSLPEETIFASSTPSIIYHDFAQIIQDMRDRINRRVAKRVVKEKPKPAVKKKYIIQEPSRVYKCKRCDVVFDTKVC
ncbi:uncharacterized protein LOC113228566 [Hyposmocoma kahamanoa]|uniref:uncharacterized protein LOC113228566 n=1 Tax=Hyposmocoma kahamanoa TaxID=1477025 RepID=UPI000E6D6550|nr:uncharacterized protein LOC113228566 [Hyposmocoma kahamanoa]